MQLLDDAESKPAGEPKRIDLRLRRDVSIVEAEGQDVSGDNFEVPGGNNTAEQWDFGAGQRAVAA